MKSTVLIIGYVWVETTSAAGSRMLQLIEQFLSQDYTVVFASASQKTEQSINLKLLGVIEESIILNSSSFDIFISQLKPNIVVFDRFMIEEQFGWRVTENCPRAIRILDTEDLHFLRKVREKSLKKEEEFCVDNLLLSDLAKREIASILRCDLSLIISSFEMELLINVFKIDKRLLLHLPFLLDQIHQTQIQKWFPFHKRNHFVFAGNFLHAPNVDAVLQLKTIWSAIRTQLPFVQMHIYGAYASQQISELHKPSEKFFIKGFIPDITTVLGNARVVLAPLRFGAGIKGKLTEAMQYGTPSVTTEIGAEGMFGDLAWSGLISNLENFALNAVTLYTNKNIWLTSQQNGVLIINTIYDKQTLGTLFFETIYKIRSDLFLHRKQNFFGGMLQLQTLNYSKYMSKWIELKNNLKNDNI